MLSTQTDYRDILKSEFEQRCESNPAYSLRAFSRDLEMSASFLSEVFNEKHGISLKQASKISQKLGFSKDEKNLFCNSADSKHARSKVKRKISQLKLEQQKEANPYYKLTLDTFKVISDWYHLAILELVTLKSFKSDVSWVAKQLGINKGLAKLAIERLLRLSLLKKNNRGRLSATREYNAVGSAAPSDAIKKFHKQILEMALQKLYVQPVDQRDFSAHIFSFRRSDLKQARQHIETFRQTFSKRFDPKSKKDSVYCLSTQLFKLNNHTEGDI